jgi:hypothetical protein
VSKTRRVPQRARAIRRLAKLRETFGPDTAAERERLLRACGGARCRSGKELSSLHETLCFARAYPDNRAVLDLVQDLLDRWSARTYALRDVTGASRRRGQRLSFLTHGAVGGERWPARAAWLGQPETTAWHRCSSCSCRAPVPPSRTPLTCQWVRHLKARRRGGGTFSCVASPGEHERALARGVFVVGAPWRPACTPRARRRSSPACVVLANPHAPRVDLKREIKRPPKRMRHVNHSRR